MATSAQASTVTNLLFKIFFVFILTFIFLIVCSLIAYLAIFNKRILTPIYINDVHVGSLKPEEAQLKVKSQLPRFSPLITLEYNSNQYTIETQELKSEWAISASVSKAFMIGHNSWQDMLKTQWELFHHPEKITLKATIDSSLLETRLASIAAQIQEPPIPSSIEIITTGTTKTASVSAGKPGKKIDLKAIQNSIETALSNNTTNLISIETTTIQDSLTNKQIKEIESLASNLLDKTLFLKLDEEQLQLTDKEMISLLSVYSTFDDTKIASWTAQLANTINRKPQNALFKFNEKRVDEFQPAIPGLELDSLTTGEKIKTGILALSKETNQSFYSIDLPVKKIDPDITTEEVNSLGIKELIGKGESWFSHSIPSRVHNVAHSASKVNGILVPPGEVFSFVEQVGDIDVANGFQQAYVIQNGRTVLGDGGGVCQTSTTLFRAALNAGLEILERNAHAYRVSYYEENFDPGIDATIYSPSVDFKFRNDTAHHILIQSNVDTQNLYMTFEIYGTKDGREVSLTKPVIWNQIPPPPDRYQDDPSLPAGVVKQVDWRAWGANVSFDWKVTKNGQTLHEKTFSSNYRPWQAVFLKGTGGV